MPPLPEASGTSRADHRGQKREPSELSLEELLEGAGADGLSGAFERAFECRLRETARQWAFTSRDPSAVVAELPGCDGEATEALFGSTDARFDDGGGRRSFVLEAPETFPHRRYVASYFTPPASRFSTFISSEAGGALRIWLWEAPSGDGGGLRSLPKTLLSSADGRDALRGWMGAFPGLWGNYERRLRGFWNLQPAGSYKIRMNFLEDIGLMDLCGEGGLLELYPSDDFGCGPYTDIHTGDVTVRASFGAAREFAAVLEERMRERGVLCEPRVALLDTSGKELAVPKPWSVADDYRATIARVLDDGRDEPDQTECGGVLRDECEEEEDLRDGQFTDDLADDGHRPLCGLAPEVVPDEERARLMVLAVDSFMVFERWTRRLEKRIADERVPNKRKRELEELLAEAGECRNGAMERLLADPEKTAGLVASLERERRELHELARGIHLDRLGGGGKHLVESRLRDIDMMRNGEKRYYG